VGAEGGREVGREGGGERGGEGEGKGEEREGGERGRTGFLSLPPTSVPQLPGTLLSPVLGGCGVSAGELRVGV
jgi:hypothetical protein